MDFDFIWNMVCYYIEDCQFLVSMSQFSVNSQIIIQVSCFGLLLAVLIIHMRSLVPLSKWRTEKVLALAMRQLRLIHLITLTHTTRVQSGPTLARQRACVMNSGQLVGECLWRWGLIRRAGS